MRFLSSAIRANFDSILKALRKNPAVILITTCQLFLLAGACLFFNGQIASSELLSSIAYFSILAGVIVESILLFSKRGI